MARRRRSTRRAGTCSERGRARPCAGVRSGGGRRPSQGHLTEGVNRVRHAVDRPTADLAAEHQGRPQAKVLVSEPSCPVRDVRGVRNRSLLVCVRVGRTFLYAPYVPHGARRLTDQDFRLWPALVFRCEVCGWPVRAQARAGADGLRGHPMTAPDADRAGARRALLDVLDAHTQAGRAIPCRVWPLAGWTSEDVEEQALAARLCPPCPALGSCGEYGDAFPLEFGVYSAKTNHERRPTLGRPRKTTEAAEEREAS